MPRGDSAVRGLQLFALSGMALAQPILDLLARDAPFLVAHRASGADSALLMAALLLAPPGLAWCTIELLARMRPGAGR